MDSDKLREAKYAMNARMFLLIASIVLIVNSISTTMMDGIKWFNIVGIIEDYDAEHPGEEEAEDTAAVKAAEDAVSGDTDAVEETGNTAAEAADKEEDIAAEETAEADKAEDTTAGETAADAGEESREIDVPALKKDMKTLGISINDLRILGFACIFMVIIRCVAGAAILRFSNRVDKAPFILKTVIGLTAFEAAYVILTFLKRALFLGALIYTVLILVFLYIGAFRMKKLHEADPDRILAVNTQRAARPQAAPAPKISIRARAMMNKVETDEADAGTDGAAVGEEYPASDAVEEPVNESDDAADAPQNETEHEEEQSE